MTALLHRHIGPRAVELLAEFPGLVLEGARQVGKSTLAERIIASDAVVTTLDDPQTRASAMEDPTGFVDQAGSRPLVIDEIQRVPELTLAVKASIDRDRRPGRFVLTGSSSLLRVRGTADSLAGRVARLNMYGLSRGEALAEPDDFSASVLRSARDAPGFTTGVTRSDYASTISEGAYPEARGMSARTRASWIDSYLEGIMGRDLPQLRREIRPVRATSLLRTLAGRQSAELVKATLAQETSIPAGTITGYLDLLHDVGLVASIPPWTPNLAKREIGRPKTVVLDSGVALRLARLTAEQLTRPEHSEALGSMLEGFVAAELLRQRTWSERDFDVFHYRDRDGDEVDLILECDDGSVIGIEVKASTSFRAVHFSGLKRMRDRLGERFVVGVVLNTGPSGYRFSDRLIGLPIAALWEFRP